MLSSCSYTSSLIEEELGPEEITELLNSTTPMLLDTDKPLENLSGQLVDEVLNQSINILDISDSVTSTVQYSHISSSSHCYTPPSSPESPGQDTDGAWYPYEAVSSSCSPYPETPITPKKEPAWYPSYTSAQASPDSSCDYYPYSCQPWYQNDLTDANNNTYLPPSPSTIGYEDVQSNVAFDEMTDLKEEDYTDYEAWLKFEHVRSDGTCECLEKKNVTKCLAQKSRRRRTNQLWHFLLEVLSNPKYRRFIRWINKEAGVFRFEQSQRVARLWGEKKQKKTMSYEYMSRAMRHYYIQGIMRRVGDKRLTYQFGPNAENWRRIAFSTPA